MRGVRLPRSGRRGVDLAGTGKISARRAQKPAETLLKMLTSGGATAPTEAAIAIAISDAMKAYSIAVAPPSWRQRLITRLLIGITNPALLPLLTLANRRLRGS